MSLTRALTRPEKRMAEFGDSSIPPPSAMTGSAFSDTRIPGAEDALTLIPVLTCVGILADSVSTLPLDALQRSATFRTPVEPKPTIVSQAWHEIEQPDFLSQIVVSLALRGNFYGLVTQRDNLLRAQQVMPLHPDQVSVRRDHDGNRVYRVNGTVVDVDDVLHIPNLTVPGSLVGLNPIAYVRTGIQLTKNAEAFGAALFDNGVMPSGSLEVLGDLDDNEIIALARQVQASHTGVGKSHLPLVLTAGTKWNQISINPDDAQFLETRAFQRSEIAALFRVPPHMMGDVDKTTSWGAGIEQQEIGFVVNTLRPYLVRIENALSRLLPGDVYCKFNLKGRLRGDTGQRFAAYVMAILNGWMSIDEVRELEDLPPLPNGLGQKHYFALNYAPIGEAPPDVVAPVSDDHARMMQMVADILKPQPPPAAIQALIGAT